MHERGTVQGSSQLVAAIACRPKGPGEGLRIDRDRHLIKKVVCKRYDEMMERAYQLNYLNLEGLIYSRPLRTGIPGVEKGGIKKRDRHVSTFHDSFYSFA